MSAQQFNFGLEEAAKTMRILVAVMLTGLAVYTGIAFFLIRGGFSASPDLAPVLGVAVIAVGAGLVVVSSIVGRIFTTDGHKVDSAANDRKRVKDYLQLKLIKTATAEGWGILGTTALLVTGVLYFLAVPVLAAWLLVRQFPRPGEIERLTHRIGAGASTHADAIDP